MSTFTLGPFKDHVAPLLCLHGLLFWPCFLWGVEKNMYCVVHCGKPLLQVTHSPSLVFTRWEQRMKTWRKKKGKQRSENRGQLCLKSFSAVLPISLGCFGTHKQTHSHSRDAAVTQSSRQGESAAGLTWRNTTNRLSQNRYKTYCQSCVWQVVYVLFIRINRTTHYSETFLFSKDSPPLFVS